jgi:3'(2'), 5'-bisphosphate nucleotidase
VLAKRLARKAGLFIMDHYGSDCSIEYKDDDSPLTIADKGANTIILDGIKDSFPVDALLSEVEEDDLSRLKNERVWIVDPLDGPKEFIKNNGEFTVNIALTLNHEPVLGVIYLPAKDEWYYARKGGGAYFEKGAMKEKLFSSKIASLSSMTLVKSRSHASEKLTEISQKANFLGDIASGSSVKGCLVAHAKADVYIRLGNTHEWDVCAMDCIIRESGALMTSLQGKQYKYNQKSTVIEGFVVSNNTIHQDVLDLIHYG